MSRTASTAPGHEPAPAGTAASDGDRQQVGGARRAARSSRCRVGTASGHASRTGRGRRPARVQTGVGVTPSASGRCRGSRSGGLNSMIPRFCGQVARILDRPVEVVAERRVAGGLEPVQVVVGRAGRRCPVGHEVVQRRAPATGMAAPSPADQPRRHQPPPLPTNDEERRREHDVRRAVQASPNRSPTRNWRRRPPVSGRRVPTRGRRARSAGGSAVVTAGHPGPSRRRPDPPRSRGRSPGTSARPRRCAPGTRSSRAAPCTRRPSRTRRRRSSPSRTTTATGSRPSSHQQIADSSAARTMKTPGRSWPGPRRRRTARRMTAGSGGNGSSPRGTPSIGGDRQDVLEVRVARGAGATG